MGEFLLVFPGICFILRFRFQLHCFHAPSLLFPLRILYSSSQNIETKTWAQSITCRPSKLQHLVLPLFLALRYFPNFLLSSSSLMKKLPFLAFLGVLPGGLSAFYSNAWKNHPLVCPSISLPSMESLRETWYSPPATWAGHPRVTPHFPRETFVFLLPQRKGRIAEEEGEFGERKIEKYLFWNTNIVFAVA